MYHLYNPTICSLNSLNLWIIDMIVNCLFKCLCRLIVPMTSDAEVDSMLKQVLQFPPGNIELNGHDELIVFCNLLLRVYPLTSCTATAQSITPRTTTFTLPARVPPGLTSAAWRPGGGAA